LVVSKDVLFVLLGCMPACFSFLLRENRFGTAAPKVKEVEPVGDTMLEVLTEACDVDNAVIA